MTRSRCDDGHLPSAKLLQAGRGEIPPRAAALSGEESIAQESPNGLDVPTRQFGGLRGGVPPARGCVRRVGHLQIISNYRYLQRQIIVTNDCFMG